MENNNTVTNLCYIQLLNKHCCQISAALEQAVHLRCEKFNRAYSSYYGNCSPYK